MKAPKLKVLLVLAIIVVATIAGGYYYLSTSPKTQFTIAPSPPFFHVVPGTGAVIMINVTRSPGFTGNVNVTITDAPNWVNYHPISVAPSATNGTLAIGAAQNAPKGVVQLTLSATAANSAPETAMLAMKVVGSYNFTTRAGKGQIYDTTKTLDNATIDTLVSYVNGTVTFSQSTPQLQSLELGDVMLLLPKMSSTVPKGVSRVVLNVQKSGGQIVVLTKQAGLLDIFVTLHIGTPTRITNSTGGLSGTSVQSISAPQDGMPNTCPNDGNTYWLFGPESFPKGGLNAVQIANQGNVLLTAELTYGICLHAAASISIHWEGCFGTPVGEVCPIPVPGLDYAELTLQGFAEATFEMNGKANSVVTEWTVPLGGDMAKDTIVICPGLWIDYHLYLEGEANGHIGNHDFDLKAYAKAGFIEGPAYQNGGWTWLDQTGFEKSCNFCSMDFPTVQALQGMSMRFGIGPRLDGDIDSGLASAHIALHGFGELDVLTIPSNPLWTLYGGLDVTAGIGGFFGVGSANWGPYDLFKVPIITAQNYPPSTPVLIILNTADTIDLSNPSFLNPNPISGWGATMSAEPEGEAVTCTWRSNEVGQLGTSMATGNSLLACPGPSLTSFPIDQIIGKGLNQLTVTVVAEDSAGEKSSLSNAVTVHIRLPLSVLQIQYPMNTSPPQTITQGMPFNAIGTARLPTVVSSSYPNGIIDLCQTEPQNIAWFVGGYYQADIVDVGEGGWVGAQSSGTSCNPTLAATSPGQTMINMAYLATDPKTGNQYIAQDNNGKPIYVSVTVNVQAQTTQPPSGGTQLVVMITTPAGTYSDNPAITPSSPPIQLSGTVTGGTPPYSITWYAQWESNTATIVTGDSSVLNYAWNVAASCYALGFPRGTVLVFLKATDSTSATGNSPAGPIQVNVNCQVAQSLPPAPGIGVALVSLLTLLFAVTAERSTILQSKPWRRRLVGPMFSSL